MGAEMKSEQRNPSGGPLQCMVARVAGQGVHLTPTPPALAVATVICFRGNGGAGYMQGLVRLGFHLGLASLSPPPIVAILGGLRWPFPKHLEDTAQLSLLALLPPQGFSAPSSKALVGTQRAMCWPFLPTGLATL